MAEFHEWEAAQFERALSYSDPELDAPVGALLRDLAMAEVREITPDDLYVRLGFTEHLDPPMKVRIGDAMRRLKWRKKGNPRKPGSSGPHSSWVWVPADRLPRNEGSEITSLTRALRDDFTHLTEVLAAQHTSLSEVLGVQNYAYCLALSALMQIVANPRLKARSPQSAIRAAGVLFSPEARAAFIKLQAKLDEIKKAQARAEADRAARARNGVDFEVGPDDPDEMEL